MAYLQISACLRYHKHRCGLLPPPAQRREGIGGRKNINFLGPDSWHSVSFTPALSGSFFLVKESLQMTNALKQSQMKENSRIDTCSQAKNNRSKASIVKKAGRGRRPCPGTSSPVVHYLRAQDQDRSCRSSLERSLQSLEEGVFSQLAPPQATCPTTRD